MALLWSVCVRQEASEKSGGGRVAVRSARWANGCERGGKRRDVKAGMVRGRAGKRQACMGRWAGRRARGEAEGYARGKVFVLLICFEIFQNT